MRITKFGEISIPNSSSDYITNFQESVAIGKKVEVLLPHIVRLEESLDSRPGDVAELERRDILIQYAMIYPPCVILTSF